MDPVSIIGLVAAAVQFADVGKQLVSRFRAMHASADGRTMQEKEALTKLEDLCQFAAQTQNHPICVKHRQLMHEYKRQQNNEQKRGSEQKQVPKPDENLELVLKEVQSVPIEFEDLLKRLKGRSNVRGNRGRDSASKSLQAAVGSIFDESRVKELRTRLDKIEERTMRFAVLSLW